MLRPITVAPMFASDSSTAWALAFTAPPSRPCMARQAASGKAHSCRRIPPIPSGLSTLWLGPATKPSSDIEILKRSFDTSGPPCATGSNTPLRDAGALVPLPLDRLAADGKIRGNAYRGPGEGVAYAQEQQGVQQLRGTRRGRSAEILRADAGGRCLGRAGDEGPHAAEPLRRRLRLSQARPRSRDLHRAELPGRQRRARSRCAGGARGPLRDLRRRPREDRREGDRLGRERPADRLVQGSLGNILSVLEQQ